MKASTAAPERAPGSHGTQGPHELDELHALHDAAHGGAHVHVLSALQEEVLCWTAGCFVVVAIVFAVWTLRTAPAQARKARRKKRRPGRSARRLRAKRR